MSTAALAAHGARADAGSRIARAVGLWRLPGSLLLDRYILRSLLGWYLAVIALVTLLLWLETLPRLVARLGEVRDGTRLVVESLTTLWPEYLAIGVPLALFLGTAMTFRRLALAGEIEVLAGAGLSNLRLLRWPHLVALLSALLLVALLGWIQPMGERRLDAIGLGAVAGDYGIRLEAGIPHGLGGNSLLYFDRIGPQGELEGVVVAQAGITTSARAARITPSRDRDVVIALSDGVAVDDRRGQSHAVRFRSFRITVTLPATMQPARLSPRTLLDRYSFAQLLHLPERARRDGLTDAMAAAALSARAAMILFCAFLPGFAFALAMPPKRTRSGLGLGAGIGLIVLFWRLVALIQDRFGPAAPAAHAGLILAFGGGCAYLLHLQRTEGFGAVEAALARTSGRFVALITRRRRA